MKNFTIKVTEHREGLVVVEGKDENDALERLGRIIDSDAFWSDFENFGEYSLATEVESDDSCDDPIAEWNDESYRDLFGNQSQQKGIGLSCALFILFSWLILHPYPYTTILYVNKRGERRPVSLRGRNFKCPTRTIFPGT